MSDCIELNISLKKKFLFFYQCDIIYIYYLSNLYLDKSNSVNTAANFKYGFE